MNKQYSHFIVTAVSQFMLGLIMLVQTLYYVKPTGVPFWITIVIDAGLIISGIVFFVIGIRKQKEHDALSKKKKTAKK